MNDKPPTMALDPFMRSHVLPRWTPRRIKTLTDFAHPRTKKKKSYWQSFPQHAGRHLFLTATKATSTPTQTHAARTLADGQVVEERHNILIHVVVDLNNKGLALFIIRGCWLFEALGVSAPREASARSHRNSDAAQHNTCRSANLGVPQTRRPRCSRPLMQCHQTR